MSAHRFDQLFDKVGETVSIYQRTEGAADEFNNKTFTWSLQTTETAIIPAPTTKTFAELMWSMAGKMEGEDRIVYFKADSVIALDKRVVIGSEWYEVSSLDAPKIFDTNVLKIAILRRILEQ